MVFRPSLQSRRARRRPGRALERNVSISTYSSVPRARVITLRWGWLLGLGLGELALAHQLAAPVSGRRRAAGGCRRAAGRRGCRRRGRRRWCRASVDERRGDRRPHPGARRGRCATARGCGGWPGGSSSRSASVGAGADQVEPRRTPRRTSARRSRRPGAPPMPSATMKSGERIRYESSLERRTFPVWVTPAESTTRDGHARGPVRELGLADRDDVAGDQAAHAAEAVAVHERAVGRAQVLDDVARPGRGRSGHGGRKHTRRRRAGYRGRRHVRRPGRGRSRSRSPPRSSGLARPPGAARAGRGGVLSAAGRLTGRSTMLSWPTVMSREATRITRQMKR